MKKLSFYLLLLMPLVFASTALAQTPDPVTTIKLNAPPNVKITDFGQFFSGAVAFILLIAFILAFLFLILGGISWITSGGDKAALEAARNKIISALIGLIIVAASWAIFRFVGAALGFDILGGFQIPTLYKSQTASPSANIETAEVTLPPTPGFILSPTPDFTLPNTGL